MAYMPAQGDLAQWVGFDPSWYLILSWTKSIYEKYYDCKVVALETGTKMIIFVPETVCDRYLIYRNGVLIFGNPTACWMQR